MAKKKTAKEKREEQKKQLQKKIKVIQVKQLEEEAKQAAEKEQEVKEKKIAARQKIIENLENQDEKMKKIRKSKAKAAGLKSTFILSDNTILMTSFGKGNQALRDKYISGNDVVDASEKAVLSVLPEDKEFSVSGRMIKDASVDNPIVSKRKPGEDLICCREKLERMYFGKTFEDNIHIQLIYNILDIEKILAVQVNNVVFSLDNLLRRPDEEHDDFIGYMGFQYTYDRFCEKGGNKYQLFQQLIHKPQMGYFGNTFLPVDKQGKRLDTEEDIEAFEKKCYYLFTALGTMRQATAHGSENNRSAIYTMGEQFDNKDIPTCRVNARRELDKLYKEKVHELNVDFLKTSNKDLSIFFRAYNIDSKEKQKYLVQEYYKFVVLKTAKNIGFSIKRLRETMIDRNATHLADEEYNTVRRKLYRAVDFSIYLYFQQEKNIKEAEELIEKLRASSKESEKEYLYRETAEHLWNQLKEVIDQHILPQMNGDYISGIKEKQLDQDLLEDVLVKETADTFSEMIYLLTIFLDGKEINDLLTQLINRFDNISSFLSVMKEENIKADFQNKYEIFSRSKEISEELRVINSFARMSKPAATAKKIMFIEAAQVLGYEESEEELGKYIDSLLDSQKTVGGKNKKGFRNFIINNVIDSSRFKYLVRYGNPKKIRALAFNKNVVDFVLNEIPDTQIVSYYNSCNVNKREYFPEMRDNLSEIITGLHFRDFENVCQANTDDDRKKEDKERKKNIIRLYLTVLYLLQKNLIYVNSRYYLAFHCAERDAMVYDNKKYTQDVLTQDRMIFAKEFVKNHSTNKRARIYLEQNFDNADKWSLRAFRNCTEHLNAVRNADKYIGDIRSFHSYFELYHYLVQRCLVDQFKHDCITESTKIPGTLIMSKDQAEGKLLHYFELVEKYGTYCKDFVKALNVPFAYNLPRYKNLSINELFDRNNYLPEKGRMKALKPEEN